MLLLLFALLPATSLSEIKAPESEVTQPLEDATLREDCDPINKEFDIIQFVNIPAADDPISDYAMVNISPMIDPDDLLRQFHKNPGILAGPLDAVYAFLVGAPKRHLEDDPNEMPVDYRLPVYDDPTWR